MQTFFITDWRAVAVPLASSKGTDAAVSIRYFDHTGRQVGNSVATAAEFAEQARAMLAMAEAAILYAARTDGAAKAPHQYFPIMRDVRVADTPPPPAAAPKPPVVIYGPRASGKTFHSDRFCQRYECAAVIDLSGTSGKRRLSPNTLYLVDTTQADARSRFGRDTVLVSIHDARSAIGVGPVRSLAEWRTQ